MKIAEFYCDLCGKRVEGQADYSEGVVLNNILSSMSSKKNLDLYVCDDCVEELNKKAEKTQERILRGERTEVKEETTTEEKTNKEKTLEALNTLANNIQTQGVKCPGINCITDKCPFLNDIKNSCRLIIKNRENKT